jgi:phosphomannomutase
MPASRHSAAPLPERTKTRLLRAQERVRETAPAAQVPPALVADAFAKGDPFLVSEWIVPRRGELPQGSTRAALHAVEDWLRVLVIAHPATQSRPVEPIVFGTGGHRGQIGLGITFAHVFAIVQALINTIEGMSSAERKLHYGAGTVQEVKRRGFVFGHDNRLFNPELSAFSADLLAEAGYRVAYAGRCATPQLSFIVPKQSWAGAINFTPSHNPFRYGGIKLNPTDGGLAGSDITDSLEHEANRILEGLDPAKWWEMDALEARVGARRRNFATIDIHEPYFTGLNKHKVIRLDDLVRQARGNGPAPRLQWVVDPVWGAAVPAYLRLQQRFGENVLFLMHTEEDAYFGGQTTEPNEATLLDALTALGELSAPLRGAIRNDPDSDRGLVGDLGGPIKMNRFAVLVMRYLLDLGMSGSLVTTLPTSHFGPDYARRRGHEVVLTPTGFKNFRTELQSGQALLAYEESDGLSIQGHTLDKDGIMAGLLAMRMVLHYGRSLSEQLAEVERETGRYYWIQETFAITIPARQAKERLKSLGSIRPGQEIEGGGRTRRVQSVNTEDGYKFIFDDGTWFMMRPSGTEPKVRLYAESRESATTALALCRAARTLALKAMGLKEQV